MYQKKADPLKYNRFRSVFSIKFRKYDSKVILNKEKDTS